MKTAVEWFTAARPADETPEPWLLYPLFMPGALTILGGEPKLAGKSFLITSLLRGMLSGEMFAGTEPVWAPVVYLTEQPPSSFRATMAQTGVLGQEEFHYVHNYQLAKLRWEDKVEEISEKADREAAKYIVVDTFANCVELKDDEENSAGGTIREALRLLQNVAAQLHVGVVVLHHLKKGTDADTNIINALRGHSALSDVADILAALRNPASNPHYPTRLLEVVGRYGDLPSDPLELRYQDGQYTEHSRTDRAEKAAQLWQELPDAPTRFTKDEMMVVASSLSVSREDVWWAMGQWRQQQRAKTLSPGVYRKLV